MYIKTEIDILDEEWGRDAQITVNDCVNAGKGEELVQLVTDSFAMNDELPTWVEVNDFLHFEDSYIYKQLGIRK